MEQNRTVTIHKVLLWIAIVSFAFAWGIAAATAAEAQSLTSISISGPSSVNENSTATYTATARYSNGTTRTVTSNARWSESSDYASISRGVLTARSVSSNRTVTITARYGSEENRKTASKTVTIVNGTSTPPPPPTPTLSSVTVTGPGSVNEGGSGAYTAMANFSNGTSQNVTSSATWSDNSSAATISGGTLNAGSVTSNQNVTVTAAYSYNGGSQVSGSANVTIMDVPAAVTLSRVDVTGPGSVNEGATANYTATATFSNNTTQNVTSSATWTDNSSAASISGGTLTALAVTSNQSVTVTAAYSYNGGSQVSGSANVTVVDVPATVTLSRVDVTGPASVNEGATANYTATATFSNNTTQNVTSSATWSENSTATTISTGGLLTAAQVTGNQSLIVTASYTSGSVTQSGNLNVSIADSATPPNTSKSINSTSQNRATLPSASVAEQARTTLANFNIFCVNDLGMHCGDLDHRIASILPPFNVLHAVVIQKGTSTLPPEILTDADVDVVYSAASNPNDPALANPAAAPIFKTNFWASSPVQPTVTIAFDAYDPFYPPAVLSPAALANDIGLPVPDVAQLYPTVGTGVLAADQQHMPGLSAPYTANAPQSFTRFDTDLPFFSSFPFGYRLTNMNWFAADGIPVAPYDDFGRSNAYPLMRVQAKSKNTTLTGTTGQVFASVDSVIPVSAEAACYKCHVTSADGGNGKAACIPGVDASCPTQGSPRSNTAFTVARPAQDTATDVPADAKREWAADNNIIRLHDAKHGTHLQNSTPVVCQTCHYTPALDLAHLGPLGPGDAAANGRDQRVHKTNSNVMHAYHGQFTDLFVADLPPPSDARRKDATGKLVVNAFVEDKLNNSCYQCHPGPKTKCLRGAMFNGGMVCNDCHGGMQQVGKDFSSNFSASTPFPAGADLTKRIPWANEPKCQSCHTGDAMTNLGLTDANVVKALDGIRLLQAWRTNDATNATPITATNKRFAEETATNGNSVLYRVSKGHSGVSCQSCHGSTHAEWPVLPESGASISNDNMAAIQLQGHTGKIMECTSCHAAGSLPTTTLGGPHGMHQVANSQFISSHRNVVGNGDQCRACHGRTGQGTVLSKVPVARTVGSRSFAKGEQVTCTKCHGNEL
jgi:hypothetical protein